MILIMGVIFFLSGLPKDALIEPMIPGGDKLAHAMVYGLLAASFLYALPERFKDSFPGLTMLSTVIFCLLYGLSDEYHQSFVPGRLQDSMDLIADTIGAIVATCLWKFRQG